MDNITSLAEYGATGIAIAILIVIALIIRWLIPVIKETLERLVESIIKNTEVTNKMSEYLKLKNGALEKLILKTEQKILKGQKEMKQKQCEIKKLK